MRARPLDLAAIGTLATAFIAGLVVPPDAVQGDLQRIMYVHVPSAWLAYLSFTITLVGSVMYLWVRSLRWDRLAGASAEVGVVFTGLALATGMIWGKPIWGVWWTWDARLVLTAVMFFVYLLPDAFAYRTNKAMAPFLAFLVVAGAGGIGTINPSTASVVLTPVSSSSGVALAVAMISSAGDADATMVSSEADGVATMGLFRARGAGAKV